MYVICGLLMLAGIVIGGTRDSLPLCFAIGGVGILIGLSNYYFSVDGTDSVPTAPVKAGQHTVCPACQSDRITVQVVTESQLERVRHGAIWWVLVGWWWVPVKWLFFMFPALIVKIFAPKKQKIVSTHKSMFVCQSCGNMWEASPS